MSGLPASHSIAARLALMFAVVAMAVFPLLGLVLDQVFKGDLERHQREQVRESLEAVRYLLEHSSLPGLAQSVREKIQSIETIINPRIRFSIWSDDPAYRYGHGSELIARRFPPSGQPGRVLDLEPDAGAYPAVMLGVALPANDMHPALVLAVSGSNPSLAKTLHTFECALVSLTLVGTALVAGLGYLIARVGLQPLGRMSADAQFIGPDNRGLRLSLSPLPHELLHLGQSFNAALDRLDVAYHQLETFNADVAHELRTPLANMIGQTQVALARQREAAELREVLQSNLEELERMRAIVADMLFLARAEQGERAYQKVEVSMAAEVGKTLQFFDVLLEEARMHVTVDGDALAPIETALFRRALNNLLQNAIQHSPPGAGIQVHIARESDHATVAFSNPGDPIPPEQLARLFDRFYRIDAARLNSGENHGLGLAIVKAVAAMHNGQVFARAQDGVVTVGFSVALKG